ncbi:synaptotagmin-like protein 2 isoform X15 [Ambystoma mexicanum]|uniref:synaptotagmin-like protein 2 isoform X15 n=1 Tax=Ambystoma mexicanum TaxID=8296 RepID=UPI0037E93134
MIDLSFLTEEEQEAIMKVLQRDAELKKAEEDRVRVLEDSIDDTNELKNKTGQWFYEAKSKRHRDKIHGADLIRASIRKKKPQTIAELSQSISERSKKSWVSNVNKDLFVPPELFGVMEEPDREDEEEKTQGQLYRSAPKVDNLAFSESEANIQKAVSSPSKQRRNPFNTTSHDNFDLTPENHISENGSARLHEIPEKDVLPISRKSQKSKNIPTIEFSETNQTSSDALIGPDVHEEKKVPKPKARTVTYKIADPQSDSDSSFSKPAMRNDSINGTGARKGILKRSPSSSSTDSEVLRVSYSIDSQSKPVAPTSPIPEGDVEKNDFGGPSEQFSQNSVDRFKQVRFTSISAPDELPETPDSHNGKEIGEFDLLESDYGKNSVDNSNGMNYLHNEHQSSEYRIPAHPETVDFDSNIAVTVSKEEDGDSELALALQSLPSKVDQDVRANVPSAKQVPSSSVIAVQPLPSNSEFLQDGPPAVFTNLRTPKDVSANGNEVPTNDTFSNNQSMDQLNIRSQTSEFVVDQQPIYAQIKSPRKLDSSDSLQGRESIDETEPSRKTEIILKKTLQPKNDDKRDNSNISHNLQCNRNVRVSDDVTFGNSTHVNERKSSFYVADQQPLDAEIKSPQVSKLNSTDHPQGSEDDLNPVMADLRRTSSKPKPSKSLEDLSSASSKEEKGNQQEAFYETIPNSSTMPSYPDNRFSDPEKLKRLSKSVPDFLNDESDDRETDSTSGGSYQLGRHKKTPSSLTNLSGSSGMASLSSVSGSVMSIYSGDFGNVDIKGNIQFSIDYVEQLREFHIFVTECKDLAVADVKKNRSDPYVKSYLLPDKEKMGKRKTTVKKKTLNPAYNEILRYKINKPHLLTQKLNLSVWHNDTFGRNSFLGEVDIHLAAWDWNNKQMNWYPLQPRTPAAGIGLENRGEMTISLKYTSIPSSGKNAASSGEVHIWVKSCSNLPILRGNRINSFVKCTVLPDTSRKSRQKTRNVDKTINPVFNHTMVYDGFRAEDLREACVELTVWDHNRLANHFLGGLRLGLGSGKSYGTPVDWMDSTSYEASLWKRMMNSPDQWVEDTLQLRMLMMAKMAK